MSDDVQPVSILLVEDNPDHAELTQRALLDGNEALDYVFRRGRYAEPGAAERPGLVLLDIKLPKVDGYKVLRQIKDDPDLCSIPVIMLTTSAREEEIASCYEAGANSFVTKPVQFGEFMQKLRTLKLYWVLTSQLPRG
jgi:CheY-like chemotaxis protein